MSAIPPSGPPPIPLNLVEYLEAAWPDRFPDQILGDNPNAIAGDMLRHAGRLEVVRFLRLHANRQSAAQPKPARPNKAASA